MLLESNSVLLARVVILPFAIVQWVVVLWYARGITSRGLLKNLFACVASLCVFFGTAFLQFFLYRWALQTARLTDHYVSAVGFVENIVSLILLFRILLKSEKTGSRRHLNDR